MKAKFTSNVQCLLVFTEILCEHLTITDSESYPGEKRAKKLMYIPHAYMQLIGCLTPVFLHFAYPTTLLWTISYKTTSFTLIKTRYIPTTSGEKTSSVPLHTMPCLSCCTTICHKYSNGAESQWCIPISFKDGQLREVKSPDVQSLQS